MFLSLFLMLAATAFAANLAFTRPREFAFFLLPAGVLSFGAETDGLGGLANLSAIWLLILIALSAIVCFRLADTRTRWSTPEICYVFFLGWCAVESVRAGDLVYAVRGFSRLLFPFLSIYLIRRSVDSEGAARRLVNLQFRATAVSGLIFWGMLLAPAAFGLIVQLFWYGAVFFDHAAVLTMLALATWKVRREPRAALLALFLAAICFRAVNRTTIMALAVGASVFCLVEYRKLAVLLLPAVYIALGAVLLTVPAFREKMFYASSHDDESISLSAAADGDGSRINNNGRFAMWDVVLMRFYRPNPLLGSGLGATQAWFYGGGAKEAGCGNLKVEHSEYVRLLSDVGLIGMGLFLLTQVLAVADAIRSYRRSSGEMAKVFSIAGICAVPVFFVCMGFDNALLYVIPVAQFPLAFVAIASALSSQRQPTAALPYSRPIEDAIRWLPRRSQGERFANPYQKSATAAGPGSR